MAKTVYVSEDGLGRLLQSLESGDAGDVYVAIRRDRGPEFCRLDKAPDVAAALRQPRPVSSPKAFLQPARERVAVYSTAGGSEADAAPVARPCVILGLRGCDLKAIEYLDKVFLEGEFRDPFYAARRQAQTLISVDCVQAHETCFCTAVGCKPYAEAGFDLNLTPIDGGYVVEAGSDKGRAILQRAGAAAQAATDAQNAEREAVRRRMVEAVEKQTHGLRVTEKTQAALLSAQKTGRGLEASGDCVECAACTFICPTCYCFYLHDQAAGDQTFERLRTWDSCVLGDYSRMAGPPGAKPTPRPRLRSRFANRLLHKFVFGPSQFGMLGCVGCGRCVEACLGKIDIRQVLREASGDQSR
jgi:formate hydrogenlyase subunit 6/NADH:ubiquinone oxidoreductase subunit I